MAMSDAVYHGPSVHSIQRDWIDVPLYFLPYIEELHNLCRNQIRPHPFAIGKGAPVSSPLSDLAGRIISIVVTYDLVYMVPRQHPL